MDLIQNIRKDRMNQSRRRPLERKVFNTVSCIVREYGLREDFLELTGPRREPPNRSAIQHTPPCAKKRLDLPPFPMLPEAEYRLTLAIIRQWDGPYLRFAHSPEEILLSRSLHDANPSLTPGDLLSDDFETLLFRMTRELP